MYIDDIYVQLRLPQHQMSNDSTAQTYMKSKAFKSGGTSWHLEIVFIFSSSPPIEANFYVGALRVDSRNIEQVCSQKQPMPLPQNGSSGNTQKGSGRSSAPKASKSNQ